VFASASKTYARGFGRIEGAAGSAGGAFVMR
jgi:hypothetical protein